jgi:hypothetical protein
MDDLRSWCLLDKENQYSIPVYLDQNTMDTVANTFPYMVDSSKATGGGDIPSFKYNIIEHDKDFEVEGVTFTPLPGIYRMAYGRSADRESGVEEEEERDATERFDRIKSIRTGRKRSYAYIVEKEGREKDLTG